MNTGRMGQVGVPAAVVAIVVMMVVPLPSIVLDLLIALNISASVLILLVSMKVQRPLDFSVFPSLLLVATLFRLALNVSATRLVLLHGYAGSVIESFGHFVVGGSVVVGLVIFLILIVIQFIVITNGAGRVAEVAARFTLDAMPGKQMAIDADLNTGLINQAGGEAATQGRRRRGRLLRGDGRRVEVRQGRRHRRHRHHRHQPRRRHDRRGRPAPPPHQPGGLAPTACCPSATAWSRRSPPC